MRKRRINSTGKGGGVKAGQHLTKADVLQTLYQEAEAPFLVPISRWDSNEESEMSLSGFRSISCVARPPAHPAERRPRLWSWLGFNVCSSGSWETSHLQALTEIISVLWNLCLFQKVDWCFGAGGTAPPRWIGKGPMALWPHWGRTLTSEPKKRVHFHSAQILLVLLKLCFAFKWIRCVLLTKELEHYWSGCSGGLSGRLNHLTPAPPWVPAPYLIPTCC